MRTQTEGLLRERRARYGLKSAARPLQVAYRVLFPPDINVDPEWMVFLVFLVEFDVLSTTLLLWGRAGSGPATESNPFMVAIVHAPFLHFGLKLLFALFTIIIANILERNIQGYGKRVLQVACIPYIITFAVNFFWLSYTVKLIFFNQ